MSEQDSNILATPRVNRKWLISSVLFWSLLASLIYNSEVGDYLEARISRPLDFNARIWIGNSPELPESLKIYGLDDSTFSTLKSWVLSVDEWAEVLKALAARKPKAIFVDAMFSKVIDPKGVGEKAIAELAKIDVPIVVGSFVVPHQIRYRPPFKADHSPVKIEGSVRQALKHLPDLRQWHTYGPAPEFFHVFEKVGHFLYDGTGKVKPLLRVGETATLPHMAFFGADELRLGENGWFYADDQLVPMDSSGLLHVNFTSKEQYFVKTKSMKSIITRIQNRQPQAVNPGDYVLIIPNLYTGNTDFKSTPIGIMPGGFVIAALLHGVITGDWLRKLEGAESFIFIGALLGALLASGLGPLTFWPLFLLSLPLCIATGTLSFIHFNTVCPWLFYTLSFSGSALTVFAEKARTVERKARFLRSALKGSVADSKLDDLIRNPDRIDLQPKERAVTVMFVDVVGFSLVAEKMPPKIAFDNLKEILTEVGNAVHRYGGIIDRTLGDGLLCYFGYSFESNEVTPDHAQSAILCAMDIQRRNLQKIVDTDWEQKPVFPLRIGVNTTSCFIGNLGSFGRVDLTVVGNGVNFAKRLEDACHVHMILMGSNTFDMVQDLQLDEVSFRKRWIHIKHHRLPVEAYQFNPSHDQPELMERAQQLFRQFSHRERGEMRWKVPDAALISVSTPGLRGELVNFSISGFCMKTKERIASGKSVEVVFDDPTGDLARRIRQHGYSNIEAEVCWGYQEKGLYALGFVYLNLDPDQRVGLAELLREFALRGTEQSEYLEAT